jgi:hypothetical protein
MRIGAYGDAALITANCASCLFGPAKKVFLDSQ